MDGHFIDKSIQPRYLFEVGRTLGRLQNCTPKSQVRHRRYWTAQGLVGKMTKFGSIEALSGVSAANQKLISKTRRNIFKKLSAFEKRFPQRQGLIHADLHFGNIIMVKDVVGPIDFDDSGFGFLSYDLAIPLVSIENRLGLKNQKMLSTYQEALISGYKTEREWDSHDEEILPFLVTARKLLMLGWLNSRSDNPRLRKSMRKAFTKTIRHIKQVYGE
ncbi:MAG: phosphotransferase [Bdellovibrionaceae bacterium]|nr:phosphotransferase [Pseudobdellovibrionaceae bacterium]